MAPHRRFLPCFFFLALLEACSAHGKVIQVDTCGELREALGDASVERILVAPRPDGWRCTEEELPRGLVTLTDRTLLVEGQGPEPAYFDLERVNDQVVAGPGGNLTVRNMWLDDCLQAESAPYSCLFGNILPGGWLAFEDMVLSDARCVDVRNSEPINRLLSSFRFLDNAKAEGALKYQYIDDRTLTVWTDGWLTNEQVNMHFRAVNVNWTCTANVTHPLPEGFVRLEQRMSPLQRALVAAGGVALVAMAAWLVYILHRRTRDSHLPEYKIAASRGFELEQPLGEGHFGRVYKARDKSTGQPVAVKVVELLPSQRKQVAAALRECQVMAQVKHECIVRVVTFYTAQVQQRQHVVEAKPGTEYVQLGYNVAAVESPSQDGQLTGVWAARAARLQLSSGSGSLGSGGRGRGSGSSGGSGAGWRGGGAGGRGRPVGQRLGSGSGSGSSFSSSSEGVEGVVTVQVQLVMQYCDMGTLDQAIRTRAFQDASGRPRLRHIALTALEVARGLAYLHHPDRKMVHRDLSAANVLLASSGADERGFRALLSDFGLSTSLAEEATHKTSEVKGTISYMSPEVFLRDDISPALDIYSLGIIVHMMAAGSEPYKDMTPAMIILAKVRASEHPESARLPALEHCPQPLQQLIWDCTHHNRRSRPTAEGVVQHLEGLLHTLQE